MFFELFDWNKSFCRKLSGNNNVQVQLSIAKKSTIFNFSTKKEKKLFWFCMLSTVWFYMLYVKEEKDTEK